MLFVFVLFTVHNQRSAIPRQPFQLCR
jgi:hypothetical protein